LKTGELDAGIISTPYDSADEFYKDFLFNEELMLYASDINVQKTKSYVIPEELDVEKAWLLEEGNCLRNQFENICHLKENSLKPKNLDFLASNVQTLIQMVDKVGGLSILPELAISQLSDEQKEKVYHFQKPFPYREISVIYYKPTFKQKIIDEMVSYIKKSLDDKLNYNKNPKEYISIKPQ
jgi:LysR family hydrogen peroxide-inducible transcriptional activator